MPIYEYKCDNGHLFDVMQRMSEDSLTSCVECGAPVRKVMHPVNISFKGSGFYSTDYKNGSKSEKTEKTEKSESSSGNGDSSDKSSSEKGAGKKSESSQSSEKTAKKQD
ncbi:MAG: FmdB family zinc ribbon protein [Rubrobacteraceae bacterium]|jgi:putative FmdB family regulatory protein|nr:FmdB family transcriptional regulator [Rubrobacter sp.]